MPRLEIDLDERVIRMLGQDKIDASHGLCELALLELYREGRVSSGLAARNLGISRQEFWERASRAGIPFFNLSEEELEEELRAADEATGPSP